MKRFAIEAIIIFVAMAAVLSLTAAAFARASTRLLGDNIMKDYGESLRRLQATLKEEYPENPEGVFDALPLNGFDSILVLSKSGSVIYGEGYEGALFNMLSAPAYDKFIGGQAFSSAEKLAGKEVFIFFAAADPDFDFRAAAVLAREKFAAAGGAFTVNIVMEAVCFIIVIAAAFVAVMLLFVHRHDDLPFAVAVKNYIVKISPAGVIRGANWRFKKDFDAATLADKLCGRQNSIDYAAKNGEAAVFCLTDKKGMIRYLTMTCLRAVRGYKLVGNDTTAATDEYFKLKETGVYDPVTGLKKESELIKFWEQICASSVKRCLAVLINIGSRSYYEVLVGENRVKKIVRAYAERLQKELGGYGELFALGIEDLMLIVTDAGRCSEFTARIRAIGDNANSPLRLDEQLYKPDTKLGVVTINSLTNVSIENIVYNARLALKHARQSEENFYVLRAADFSAKKIDFTDDDVIYRMIENGEILVYFQPQYDIEANMIVGFEALCRLRSTTDRDITIKELVELAEQYGGMPELNAFVAEKAMQFAKSIEGSGVSISINVSPAQIMQMGFTEGILAYLEKYALNPAAINIEIVESTMVYSFNDIVRKLDILKQYGIGIHIDDFGVAYSSMLYLKKLPITALKIDKEFVDDITVSEDAKALVRNIVRLAADLKLQCICEGIETRAQCEILRDLGCHIIQGFLFSGAVSAEEAEKLLKEKRNVL